MFEREDSNLETLRLLKLEIRNAFANMAIDEAILVSLAIGKSPTTVRLYGWNPSAVSIGKNQKAENEVQLNNCKKLGVSVVRRITGGGTVFHDSKAEITYSLTAKISDLNVKESTDIYLKVYSGLKDALRILGITADFSAGDSRNCPNLTVKSRKISGSAQIRKRDVFLQHGTLLLDVDLEKMFTLIRVPWTKSVNEVVEVAKNRITSVRNELGHDVNPKTAGNALKVGFENALKMKAVEGELTKFEQEVSQRLYQEKYSTPEWNLQPKNDFANSFLFST